MRTRTGIAVLVSALAAGIPVAFAQSSGTETVLHSFGGLRGTNPQAGLTVGANGNFYGTTSMGGTADLGVVFMLTPSGQETVLHTFTGGADGAMPYAGVVFDKEGNLYGTTTQGGTANLGVVYEISAEGVETVLHSFLGGSDGADPEAGVVLDAAGNLYGTTSAGGAANAGTVFRVNAAGGEVVLYAFTGGADGGTPMAPVLLDASGNMYGTAAAGGIPNGIFGNGVVFELDSAGNETVLYTFTGDADGGSPVAGLTRAGAGNFYGATQYGGAHRAGVVYQVGVNGVETVVYNFESSLEADGPSGLVLDSSGNLYGTCRTGGGAGGYGYVFKLDLAGGQVTLYNFTGGTGGFYPAGGVIRAKNGNLYGTAAYGGAGQVFSGGVVYKLDSSFNETVLFSFSDPTMGSSPAGGVVENSSGDFFGTTTYGGPSNMGVVFQVAANGAYSVLHTFAGGDAGGYPAYGVIRDSAGNLYGATEGGGGNASVVFKLAPNGAYTVLQRYAPNDAFANSSLVRDASGNFYGTTGSATGNCPGSTVYKIDSSGSFTTLYNFTGGADGCAPQGVILDSAGNLYGTECCSVSPGGGLIYQINPAGQLSVIYHFSSKGTNSPTPALVRDAAGNFYGIAMEGGPGALYKVNTAGQLSLLYAFPNSDYGVVPTNLVRDAAGNFYCMSQSTVYKISPSGALLAEYTLPGGAGGGTGSSGLLLDKAGDLYGETAYGGTGADGVVFKLTFGTQPR